jgi:hypothetical protein
MSMLIEGVVMSAQNRTFPGKDNKPEFTLTELTVAVPGVKSMLTVTLGDTEAFTDAECSRLEMQPIRLQVVDVRGNKGFVSFRAKRA